MSADAASPTVVGHDELDDGSIDLARWTTLAEAALLTEGVTGAAELTLLFVDEATMTELNEAHLGGSGPTDVLAFPLDAEAEADEPARLLGDVVICPTVAAANATAAGRSLDDELALLVVHGVLHVLGHDHAEPDETARMRAREVALLAAHHDGART